MLLGGRIARILFTILGIAILARMLTPADFGVVAVASMILPLSIALLDGLIDVPTIREDDLNRSGLANLVWLGVVLMAGLCAAIWLAAPGLAVLLNSPRLNETLRVLCFGLLMQPFITASYALLRRQHRFGTVAIFVAVSGAAYMLFAIGLALMGLGLWSLIIGQIVSLMITALGLGLASAIPLRPSHWLQAGAAWRLGALGLMTRLLAWISTNIDTLFASAALGAAGAGIYSRAYNLTTQMKEPFAVLDQTVRQAFVAQRTIDDAAASRGTLTGLRLVVLAASFVAAGVIILREPIVAVLLGSQWGAVVLPLAILAASLPARVARLYLDGFTYARGSMRHMLVRDISIVIMLAGALWLWATKGVEFIALVVAAAHVATLFFRGGTVDVAVAGTRASRLAAIAPGYAVGAMIVGLGELLGYFLPGVNDLTEWGVRATVFAVLGVFLIVSVPNSWLPRGLIQLRRRIHLARRERR
jgi:PST family polysaccharide transporter